MRIVLLRIGLIGLLALFFLGAIFFYQYGKFNDGKLHIVFCNVGQGDGIFIRTPTGLDILVDGGPDESILFCLSNNMPFWDRSIELMFLTHPHEDHLAGLTSVLKRYSVLYFATEKLENNTLSFKQLSQEISTKKLPTRHIYTGDSFKTKDLVSLEVIAPNKEFLDTASPNGIIGESKELASLAILLSYGQFDLLLTGDNQTESLKQTSSLLRSPIEVLQIPHHGSKTGMDSELLSIISPQLAVISVGRKNKYGHPAQEVMKILGNKAIKTLRTDQQGEVEIVSDGQKWRVN